jgi:hypothetical protein
MTPFSVESRDIGTDEMLLSAAESALGDLVSGSQQRPYTKFELLLLLLATPVGKQIASDEVLARCVLNVVAREGLTVAGA